MTAKTYDTQNVVVFSDFPEQRPITVASNGGSVAIEVESDNDTWVATDTISEDSTMRIQTSGTKIRFTPSGGATYRIDIASRRLA